MKKLIYVSSGGTVYGKTKTFLPFKESDLTNPISPYGITKLAIEKYVNFYSEMHDIPYNIIRPANPFGEYQEPFKGQGFIATALGVFFENRSITIFGEKGAIRDYIYISDLVNGIITILFSNTSNGEIFNIGTGIGKSNFEILTAIKKIERFSNKKISINIEAERGFDVPYNVLDSDKLREMGWKPLVSFEEGLLNTYNWLSNYY